MSDKCDDSPKKKAPEAPVDHNTHPAAATEADHSHDVKDSTKGASTDTSKLEKDGSLSSCTLDDVKKLNQTPQEKAAAVKAGLTGDAIDLGTHDQVYGTVDGKPIAPKPTAADIASGKVPPDKADPAVDKVPPVVVDQASLVVGAGDKTKIGDQKNNLKEVFGDSFSRDDRSALNFLNLTSFDSGKLGDFSSLNWQSNDTNGKGLDWSGKNPLQFNASFDRSLEPFKLDGFKLGDRGDGAKLWNAGYTPDGGERGGSPIPLEGHPGTTLLKHDGKSTLKGETKGGQSVEADVTENTSEVRVKDGPTVQVDKDKKTIDYNSSEWQGQIKDGQGVITNKETGASIARVGDEFIAKDKNGEELARSHSPGRLVMKLAGDVDVHFGGRLHPRTEGTPAPTAAAGDTAAPPAEGPQVGADGQPLAAVPAKPASDADAAADEQERKGREAIASNWKGGDNSIHALQDPDSGNWDVFNNNLHLRTDKASGTVEINDRDGNQFFMRKGSTQKGDESSNQFYKMVDGKEVPLTPEEQTKLTGSGVSVDSVNGTLSMNGKEILDASGYVKAGDDNSINIVNGDLRGQTAGADPSRVVATTDAAGGTQVAVDHVTQGADGQPVVENQFTWKENQGFQMTSPGGSVADVGQFGAAIFGDSSVPGSSGTNTLMGWDGMQTQMTDGSGDPTKQAGDFTTPFATDPTLDPFNPEAMAAAFGNDPNNPFGDNPFANDPFFDSGLDPGFGLWDDISATHDGLTDADGRAFGSYDGVNDPRYGGGGSSTPLQQYASSNAESVTSSADGAEDTALKAMSDNNVGPGGDGVLRASIADLTAAQGLCEAAGDTAGVDKCVQEINEANALLGQMADALNRANLASASGGTADDIKMSESDNSRTPEQAARAIRNRHAGLPEDAIEGAVAAV